MKGFFAAGRPGFWLAALLVGIAGTKVCAQEPAPAEAPPEPIVVRFARHDTARWAERIAQLRQEVDAAAARLTASQQALEAAKAAGDTPEETLKNLTADVDSATKAKAAADAAPTQGEAAAKLAGDRLTALLAGPPKADPAVIRALATYKHDRPVMACRFDAAGDFLYAGTQGNDAYRWNLFTGARQEFKGHESWVGCVQPLAGGSGQQFLTAAYEGKLALWDGAAPAAQPTRITEAHRGHVRCLAVSPDGRFVATAGNDQLVKVWSVADGSLAQTLSGHAAHVYSVTFAPSGNALFSGDLMGVIKQWDTTEWKHARDLDAGPLHKFDTGFSAHIGGVRGMEVSPDGRFLVAAGVGNVSNAFAGIGDPTLVQFSLEDGKALKTVSVPGKNQGSFWSIHYHPSGEFVMLAGWPGFLWFWKPGEDKVFFEFKLPASTYDCCFHPDGLRLAVALFDKSVVVYDIGPKLAPVPAAPPSTGAKSP